jgi:hypothetical protein
MQKRPHVRDGDEKSRMDRIEAAAKQLLDKGVSPTYRNLLRIGFGSKAVNDWRKQAYPDGKAPRPKRRREEPAPVEQKEAPIAQLAQPDQPVQAAQSALPAKRQRVERHCRRPGGSYISCFSCRYLLKKNL